jgi:choline dehydrogenase-like flavoprotein
MLTSDWDRYTARYALRLVQRWANASAWDGRILAAAQNFTTDEELDQWAAQTSRMANHPSGGAQMSPYGADYGVVDPNLAVKGLKDLWVIDSSTFVCFCLSDNEALANVDFSPSCQLATPWFLRILSQNEALTSSEMRTG